MNTVPPPRPLGIVTIEANTILNRKTPYDPTKVFTCEIQRNLSLFRKDTNQNVNGVLTFVNQVESEVRGETTMIATKRDSAGEETGEEDAKKREEGLHEHVPADVPPGSQSGTQSGTQDMSQSSFWV